MVTKPGWHVSWGAYVNAAGIRINILFSGDQRSKCPPFTRTEALSWSRRSSPTHSPCCRCVARGHPLFSSL